MASATLETFCCMASKIEPSILTHLQFQSLPYNIVCVISSVFGMIGATYQVLPSPLSSIPHRHRGIGHTQKAIINWLAIADFFAASGILLRSAFWLWKGDIVHQSGWNLIVCAILLNQILYHVATWLISFAMTTAGLGTLYLPEFKCHSGPWRVLPNYLLSYIPIVFIMFMNPVLYYLSSKNVRILLTGGLGQLTYLEHNLLAALKEKFFCIVLVFYVCWLPNVLNGILLWGFWETLPRKVLVGLWYVMAVVNPLQAILNSLVYKGWDDCRSSWKEVRSVVCCCRDQPHPGLILETSSSDHQFTPERATFSTNHFD
ncbi:g-protein coupled receptor 143 [Caerostris extrusa]|uniref:G-protein coupled receptor 143 n=1 Tax=Caerostris extrusa TaxID=172846 RepID=A0AAV4RQH4_CAEEX|nr:g-protein coupled receptor 143 [Caerostris extrusa]